MLSIQLSAPIAILAILCTLLSLNTPAQAFPLHPRQQNAPTTLTTKTTTMTPSGPATKICVITLTPLPDGNFQDVQVCRLESDPNQSVASSGATAAPAPSPTTSTSGPLSSTAPAAASSVVSVATSTPSASPSNPVIVNGVSSITPVSTLSSIASTPSVVFPTSQASPTADNTPLSTISTPSATTTNASGSAAAVESTQSPGFTMPGKKLSVLPIGLGVFAGISVIALIVVGLVTYERTKYRKAFRQRKLAESGAAMGYGGLSR